MRGKFSTWVLIGLVVGGISLLAPNTYTPDPTPTDSSIVDPWAEPTDSASPDATDPAPDDSTDSSTTDTTGAPFWAQGFTAEDVTDSMNRNCSDFEMCVFVKLTTQNTCSTVTLYGSVYDAEDNYIDSFEQSYESLKPGKSRIAEFGTDALDDNEDYVELDDATCYK